MVETNFSYKETSQQTKSILIVKYKIEYVPTILRIPSVVFIYFANLCQSTNENYV